jgi:hypothetical protein
MFAVTGVLSRRWSMDVDAEAVPHSRQRSRQNPTLPVRMLIELMSALGGELPLTYGRALSLRSTSRCIFRPMAAKPNSMITQVIGSGTGAGAIWSTENLDAANLL